jgi:hypothetical protein
VDALKRKTIDRYKCFLNRVKKGYKPDYQEILNLICFINLPICLDNQEFIKQQLLNNDDTIYLQFGQ